MDDCGGKHHPYRRTSAPTQTDGSGWSQASRGSEGRLGESPVCVCALANATAFRLNDSFRVILIHPWFLLINLDNQLQIDYSRRLILVNIKVSTSVY